MYELIQVGKDTYYMDCPAKVGFYKTSEHDVVLIDSGSDKDSAKKVKKVLEEKSWNLQTIFNTHSHADHTGGNNYLQALYNCKIYTPSTERSVTESPILEPVSLYAGFPLEELCNKFLMAKESKVEILTPEVLPQGLEMINLPGHCYNMAGFKTSDNVVFLADSLYAEETLNKYKIAFMYDIQANLNTLEFIKTLKASLFVPSHGAVVTDIETIAQKNIDKTNAISDTIVKTLSQPMTFEDLLAKLFTYFDIEMNIVQHFLIGSTVKSYLSYLARCQRISCFFENNKMFWASSE